MCGSEAPVAVKGDADDSDARHCIMFRRKLFITILNYLTNYYENQKPILVWVSIERESLKQ